MAASPTGIIAGPSRILPRLTGPISKAAAVNAYTESKTRAERRAWAMMKAAGREGDLVSINPSGIYGPLLDDDPAPRSG